MWQRDRTVSGSSCARADISRNTASAGGSSSTFSKRVGRGRREPVGLADHEDLAAGLGRRARGRRPDLLADRVDVDVAALGLDQELVGVLILEREPAVAALAAAAVPAQQRRGERASGQRLAAALGPGEHVGVMWPLGRALQERHRGVLPGHPLEHRPTSWRECSDGRQTGLDRAAVATPFGALVLLRAPCRARRVRRRRPRPVPCRRRPRRTARGAPRRSSGTRRRPSRGSPGPRAPCRSGASVERSKPRSGSRCSRITRSGKSPWVAHTFSVSTSCLAEPACPPLIGERRVDVAVADHDLAVGERRTDHARHGLRTGRREQQRLAARVELAGLRVEQHLADLLPQLGATRLARDEHLL